MKIDLLYGKSAVVLPGSVVGKLDRATKRDLKILFVLAEHREKSESELAATVGCTESELMASIAFWRGAGVLEMTDDESVETVEDPVAETVTEPRRKTERSSKKAEAALADELPQYTTLELNKLLAENKDSSMLIDECQRIAGKIFNPHEISMLVGLRDYLCLDNDYIMILLAHCVDHGKKSLQYLKKRAFSLCDEGITDPVTLHEHLTRLDEAASLEGEIRKLFGMRDRELTTKEKKFISKWVLEYGYPLEVIKKAYEMTVDAIQQPVPAYTNAIIERWYAAGLKTLDAIEASESEKLPVEGSFDTNDFFESALRRSFGESDDK